MSDNYSHRVTLYLRGEEKVGMVHTNGLPKEGEILEITWGAYLGKYEVISSGMVHDSPIYGKDAVAVVKRT